MSINLAEKRVNAKDAIFKAIENPRVLFTLDVTEIVKVNTATQVLCAKNLRKFRKHNAVGSADSDPQQVTRSKQMLAAPDILQTAQHQAQIPQSPPARSASLD